MATPVKKRTKKFTYFIGIDVSRNELDYAVMQGKQLLFHREGINAVKDIIGFVAELKKLPGFTVAKAMFCMENTGYYCNHLLTALKKLKANVVVENPLQIKKSLGLVRGKDDKADAIRIAAYAQKNKDELKLWSPRRPAVTELINLFALRNRLVGVSVVLHTPLKEEVNFIDKKLQKQNTRFCKRSTTALKADLKGVDLGIKMLINSDNQLKRLKKVITSVPNIGLITAVQMIISTNEFRDIQDARKFACYAGVAPFVKSSGINPGRARVSHYANKRIKSLLHLCALSAKRWDPELKDYYERKTKVEGKSKLSVINAIRNKLILRVFACVNQNRVYKKNYVCANEITASG